MEQNKTPEVNEDQKAKGTACHDDAPAKTALAELKTCCKVGNCTCVDCTCAQGINVCEECCNAQGIAYTGK
jgi:hypothetical protein